MLEYHLATAHWKASHPIVHSGPLHTYPGINESATFISRFENSHVYTYPSVSNRICPSTRIRIHPSTQTSSWNIGNRAYVLKTGKNRVKSKRKKPGNEVAILNTAFIGKNWARSCYVTGKKYIYPDLAFTRFRIYSVFKNFQSGERSSSTLEVPVSKCACN